MKIVMAIIIGIFVIIFGRIWYAAGGWMGVVVCIGALFMVFAVLGNPFASGSLAGTLIMLGGGLWLVYFLTMTGMEALKKEVDDKKKVSAKHAVCIVYSKCTEAASKTCSSGFDVVARKFDHDEESDASTQHLYYKCKNPPPNNAK